MFTDRALGPDGQSERAGLPGCARRGVCGVHAWQVHPGAPAGSEREPAALLERRDRCRLEPRPLRLPGREYPLKVLVSHPREPLSRDKLMNLARGREYTATERSIDVQVSRLRRLLEQDPAQPRYLQTVWGLGYVFVPDGDGE